MADPAKSGEKKSGLPIKTMALVLGLLVAEAAGVIAFFKLTGGPSEVQGKGLAEAGVSSAEQMQEVLIVNDKFPNHHTGRVWLWEAEIQVKVKQKHLAHVQRIVEERNAEIKSAVGRLFRTAHHNHLTEPNLETITRQLSQLLRDIFGQDAEGEERVQAVLLPNCVGFPADF